MQSHTSPRPVMDVSAPRPVPAPMDIKPGPISVRPAPSAGRTPFAIPEQPAPVEAKKNSPRLPEQPKSTAPVGVITVAVLAMMGMSLMAVVVYMTSKS